MKEIDLCQVSADMDPTTLAMINIRDVRTIVVEIRQLRRKDGKPLADTTKTKIGNGLCVAG